MQFTKIISAIFELQFLALLSIYQLIKLKLKHITAGYSGACLKQVAKLGKMVTFSERVTLNFKDCISGYNNFNSPDYCCQMKHFQKKFTNNSHEN